MEAGTLGDAATRYAVSYPTSDAAAPTPGSQVYPLSMSNAVMPSGPEDGRTLSSSREVILQGGRTQVWREVMVLTGLFTGTVMFITSAVYIAGKLSGEQVKKLRKVALKPPINTRKLFINKSVSGLFLRSF